jgi:hypothetical protein
MFSLRSLRSQPFSAVENDAFFSVSCFVYFVVPPVCLVFRSKRLLNVHYRNSKLNPRPMNRLSLQEIVALHSELTQEDDDHAVSVKGLMCAVIVLGCALAAAFLVAAGSDEGSAQNGVVIVDTDPRVHGTPNRVP